MLYNPKDPPEYVKVKPFRFVKPYEHCYKTNAKQRWVAKNLLSAMSDEFRAYSREYYQKAIEKGKLLINHQKVNQDYKIKEGDVIEHYATRVEPPVLDIPIGIIYEDQNYLVINKPPSMIVHTGGGYHYNCVVAILFYEHNQQELYVLHRLDRLTSGLLMLSKNKQLAQEFHQANSKNTVKKTYLARVSGNFDENIKESSRPQYCKSMKDAIFAACAPEDEEKMKAKPCKTLFQKVWYDEKTDSSLIECSLITGKTHQIRVHLSDLGYPIWNDIGYGGKFVGNNILKIYFDGLKNEAIRQDVVDKLVKKVKLNEEKQEIQKQEGEEQQNQEKGKNEIDELQEKDQQEVKKQQNLVKEKDEIDELQNLEKQDIQKQQNQEKENQELLLNCIAGKEEWDYHKHPLEICLHSWKYLYKDQLFETPKPYWFEK